MLNINEVRNLFPHIERGKIYFNHASTGPLSRPVLDSINKVLYEKSETNIDEYMGLLKRVEELKNDIAVLINSSADRLAFVDNTTNGLNIIAQGIKWQKGDRIVLNDIEFPANVYPFLNLQKIGVEVDFVKSKNGMVTFEDIISTIKVSTKLISISQVQFLTGFRAELEKIGKVCKEKNIIFSVDGIQGLGAVRLDVIKDNIDFISCGSQKWLLGLQGTGFIYISEELQNKIEPKYIGWLSVKDAWNMLDYNLELKDTAERFQNGTVSSIGIYAFNASMKLFKEIGFDNIEKYVLENSSYLLKELINIGAEPVLKNAPKENLAGIVSFKYNKPEKIHEDLLSKNIHCAVREGMVRLSPHFYNTKEDIDIVIDELKKII
jgi:selenocysteine lyase/cysteine desulfurase